MKGWDKLGKIGKRAASITAIILLTTTITGLVWATYTHFETREHLLLIRAEMERDSLLARAEIINTHKTDRISDREAHNNDRVDRVERESDRIEKENLNPDLPQVDRDWNARQLEKNDKKIECIRKYEC